MNLNKKGRGTCIRIHENPGIHKGMSCHKAAEGLIRTYLDDRNIIPGIKVRRNSVPRSRGCYLRKAVTEQLTDYHKWAASVSYGDVGS